jgi:hypothetical protein
MEMRNEPNVRQEQKMVRIIIVSTIVTVILCCAFFIASNILPSANTKAANASQVYFPSGNISSSAVTTILNNCQNVDTLKITTRLVVNGDNNLLASKNVIILISNSELDWNTNASFYLGQGAKILLEKGGQISSLNSSCNPNKNIYFGASKTVSCNGSSGAELSFTDVNTAGGVQSSGVTALPVELIRFETKRNGKSIDLDWATASEHNNSHFDVERSSDGKAWKKVGTVPGNGNSQKIITYHFEDQTAELGKISYYRLKQIDFDAVFEYSYVRMVSDKIEAGTTLTSVYPNPVDKFLNVKIDEIDTYHIQLIDQTGQIKYQMETSQNLETINTSSYQMGIYYVIIQNDRIKESHKIVIKH